MKKQLMGGHFSSVPLVELLLATADVDPEDEVRDDEAPDNNTKS